jgi:hypothetical protein
VTSLWPHGDGDRPPRAGRLLGLSLALLVVTLVVRFAVETVAVLIQLVVPLVVVIGIGYVIVRRIGRK